MAARNGESGVRTWTSALVDRPTLTIGIEECSAQSPGRVAFATCDRPAIDQTPECSFHEGGAVWPGLWRRRGTPPSGWRGAEAGAGLSRHHGRGVGADVRSKPESRPRPRSSPCAALLP